MYTVLKGTYRSKFGPCISHSGLFYSNTVNNISKAFTRLSCEKLPGTGIDRFLKINQDRWQPGLIANDIKQHINSQMVMYADDLLIGSIRYALAPHPKKRLRIQALKDLLNFNLLNHPTYTDKVEVKLKMDDYGKPGKNPRMIGDISVVGSLLGGFLVKYIKGILDSYSGNLKFVTVGSQQVLIDSVRFVQRGGKVFYSDDLVMGHVCEDGVYFGEADIKSADCSHGPYTERFLCYLFSDHPDFVELISRCYAQFHLPFYIRSPHSSRKAWFDVFRKILFSGSVLTWLENCLAWVHIFEYFYLDPPTRVNQVEHKLHQAAYNAGYLISTVNCTNNLPRMTFLKHSFHIDGEDIRPYLNLGVIFRTIGTCKGDLPGKKKQGLANRAYKFNCSLITQLKHEGNHLVMFMFRDMFPEKVETDLLHSLIYSGTSYDIPVETIMLRYDATYNEIAEFIFEYSRSGFGDCYRSAFTDKVMSVDYGL